MVMKALGIEGVSARYAAQIQELLYTQAVKRAAAQIVAQREEARAAREVKPDTKVAETSKVEEIKTIKVAEPAKTERLPPERTSGSFLDTTA